MQMDFSRIVPIWLAGWRNFVTTESGRVGPRPVRARIPAVIVILLVLAAGTAGYQLGWRQAAGVVATGSPGASAGASGAAAREERSLGGATSKAGGHEAAIQTEAELRTEFERILSLRPEARREAMEAVVRRIPLSLFPLALRLGRAYQGMALGYLVESAVVARWVREDVVGAFAEAEGIPNLRDRTRRKQLLFGEWAGWDAAAAIAAAKRVERVDERFAMMRSIFEVVSTGQPALALAELRALHSHRFDDLIRQSVVYLAKTDPAAATREFGLLSVADRFRTVRDVIRELGRVDPAAADAWVAGVSPGMEQQAGVRGLVEALAVTDPARAMAKALTMTHAEMRREAMVETFREWCRSDLSAAEAWYAARSAGAERRQLFEEWLRVAAETDPAGVAGRLAGMSPPGGRQADYMETVAAGWARVDPSAAKAWVDGLPAGEPRDRAELAILQHQALSDPAGTVERVLQLPPSVRDRGMAGVFRAWMDLDSNAAVAWLKAQKPEVLAGALGGGVIDAIADRNPAEAAQLLLRHPTLDRQVGSIDNVVGRWALMDSQGAVEFSRSLPEGPVRTKALKTVGYYLASVDPESALRLAAALPAADDRRELVEQALRGAGGDDPRQLASWIGRIESGDVRNDAIRRLAGLWSEQDPKAAIAWLTAQPTGEARRDGLGAAVMKWAETDSVAAATFAAGLGDPAEQQRAVSDVLAVMSRTDVTKAAEWVAQFPANSEKVSYTTIVARGWAEKDPQAAAAWLATLPADGARFQALQPIAEEAGNRVPQWAWQWALGLSDPRERMEALVRVGEKWVRSSPEAAKAAFQGADLPELVRKRLLPTLAP